MERESTRAPQACQYLHFDADTGNLARKTPLLRSRSLSPAPMDVVVTNTSSFLNTLKVKKYQTQGPLHVLEPTLPEYTLLAEALASGNRCAAIRLVDPTQPTLLERAGQPRAINRSELQCLVSAFSLPDSTDDIKSRVDIGTVRVAVHARVLFQPLTIAGLSALVSEHCQSGGAPLQNSQHHAVHKFLGGQMCTLIYFMREALDRPNAPFMPELFSALGPAVILPTIEMRRAGYRTSVTLACMLLLGVLYQNCSGAVILPLWWALHLLLSGRQTVPLHPHYTEATFVGYLLGYLAISVAMTVYQTNAIIGLWQLFPASVTFVQVLYLGYQRSRVDDVPDCPYEVLQLIHVTNFCWSAITHAYTLFQAFRSPVPLDSLKHSFYPPFSPVSLAPAPSFTQQFLKWDILFIVASTLFAGILLLRGVRAKLLALGWFILGSLCFGMGAGLSGVWMWREKVLEEDRRASVAQLKQD
ncbi:hypothetical protein FRC10_006304 [Ceratobasidium sp. 414]|nr:hypothetical protein FRC10_006304 [Ceratobasidium sp. 414]